MFSVKCTIQILCTHRKVVLTLYFKIFLSSQQMLLLIQTHQIQTVAVYPMNSNSLKPSFKELSSAAASRCYVSFYSSIRPSFFIYTLPNPRLGLLRKIARSVAREFSMGISKPKLCCELFLISSISFSSWKIRVLLRFLIKEILVRYSQKNLTFTQIFCKVSLQYGCNMIDQSFVGTTHGQSLLLHQCT